MTTPGPRGQFPCYAYEVIPTDLVDGREVTATADQDGQVTLTFATGDPTVLDRMAEVWVRRLLSKLAG